MPSGSSRGADRCAGRLQWSDRDCIAFCVVIVVVSPFCC
uniref:Uncharacterized protein n=1 Tax=Caudovirales sp. ctU7I6 TaxID=2826776 RepID=A0A8S5QK45_9CAUD|nr:MAG TPA: hypothetical protein [Caudovirales sp. ctU7I6]